MNNFEFIALKRIMLNLDFFISNIGSLNGYENLIENEINFVFNRIVDINNKIQNNRRLLVNNYKVILSFIKKFFLLLDEKIINNEQIYNDNFDIKKIMRIYRESKDFYSQYLDILNNNTNKNTNQYISENEYTLLLNDF